jgi:dipeptidase PepV
MTIDWKAEVESRKDVMLERLMELLKIDSSRDIEHATDDAPLGPGPRKALEKMLMFAEADGFTTKNVENVAGHIEYGDGDEIFGILGHMDEVPAGEGWETNAFEPVVKDGRIYARGVSDDKGPSMAAYLALQIIKELNLPVSKKIRLIFGTDEESDWVGINRYLEVEKTPDFGFSPDAEFPIINGEKGIASFKISLPAAEDEGAMVLKSFVGGIKENMIPRDATAVVTASGDVDVAGIEKDFNDFLAENGLTGELTVDGNELKFFLIGKSAHALEPKAGLNAGTFLATFLNDRVQSDYIKMIAEQMHLDSRGHNLNINSIDPKMGDLTVTPDLFSYEMGQTNNVIINVRYPQSTDADTIVRQATEALAEYSAKVEIHGHAQEPHYVDGNDPLVKTLLSIYEEHTGEKGEETVIGGGTYGRILDRGVAFGAQFPGRENVMHQANEYMTIEDIVNSAIIYAHAIYELAK